MIFAIPFTILLNLTVAIYRGFDRTNVNMYFYNIIRPVSLLGFASAAVFLGVPSRGCVFGPAFNDLYIRDNVSLFHQETPIQTGMEI